MAVFERTPEGQLLLKSLTKPRCACEDCDPEPVTTRALTPESVPDVEEGQDSTVEHTETDEDDHGTP